MIWVVAAVKHGRFHVLRFGDHDTALAHDIQVLARQKDLGFKRNEEARHQLVTHCIPHLPVGVVKVFLEILFFDIVFFQDHEFTIGINDFATVNPRIQDIKVRHRGPRKEISIKLFAMRVAMI